MNVNDIEGKLCPDDEQEPPTTASTTKTSLKYKYELIVRYLAAHVRSGVRSAQ